MHLLLNANNAQLELIKQRARGKCLRFHDWELPRGATPERVAVGLEVASDESTTLYVQHGVQYCGDSCAIRQWLAAGQKRFPRFEVFMQWIRTEVAPAYRPATIPGCRADADELFKRVRQEVRGQDDAVRSLCDAVSRHTAKRAPRRPVTFFAIGPTGVGKTKAAETLAAALKTADASAAYLRLDMTEYQERHRVSQFFGAPPGYVGYGDGTPLIDTLSDHPRSVVLFDEIEKAHPEVLRALMNAMDAGRITSPATTARGREIDCRHAIFIFTSNLRADDLLEDLHQHNSPRDEAAADAVCRDHLRNAELTPELIGRLNHFLVFQPLSLDARVEILTLAIHRVAREYGLEVGNVAPNVILEMVKRSRLEGFGARPDEYLVDRMLGDRFAKAATDGNPTIDVCRQLP